MWAVLGFVFSMLFFVLFLYGPNYFVTLYVFSLLMWLSLFCFVIFVVSIVVLAGGLFISFFFVE